MEHKIRGFTRKCGQGKTVRPIHLVETSMILLECNHSVLQKAGGLVGARCAKVTVVGSGVEQGD